MVCIDGYRIQIYLTARLRSTTAIRGRRYREHMRSIIPARMTSTGKGSLRGTIVTLVEFLR